MANSNNFAGQGDSKNPPSSADPAGATGGGWSSPPNVTADDGSTSNSPVLASNAYSRYIYGYQFGHNVPAGATIDGIEVLIDRVAGGLYNDYEVKLSNGVIPTYTASKTADIGSSWNSNFGVATYGGPTDTWGRTWTVSEVNDIWFRASLSVQCQTTNIAQSASIDYIKTIVYYTEAGGGGGGGPDFNIKIGGQSISRIMMGDQPISRVNFGSTQI